eukprot:6214269-Pleurochrysis_carterae.AAC.3
MKHSTLLDITTSAWQGLAVQASTRKAAVHHLTMDVLDLTSLQTHCLLPAKAKDQPLYIETSHQPFNTLFNASFQGRDEASSGAAATGAAMPSSLPGKPQLSDNINQNILCWKVGSVSVKKTLFGRAVCSQKAISKEPGEVSSSQTPMKLRGRMHLSCKNPPFFKAC